MVLRQGMVQCLLDSNGEWKVKLIDDLFCQNSAIEIKRIYWANINSEDKLVWVGNKNGEFLVKSFYWLDKEDWGTNQSR